MKQHLTIDEFDKEVTRRALAKVDYMVDTDEVTMLDDGRTLSFAAGGDGMEELKVGGYCEGQIAGILFGDAATMPIKTYRHLQSTQPDLLAHLVNEMWRRVPRRRMLRSLDGLARAWLSDKFLRLDDDRASQTAFAALMERHPDAKVVSSGFTETKTTLQFVTPRIQGEVKTGDIVQFGISYSNSEVGAGQFSASLLAYQLICLNGMVRPDMSFGVNHVGRRLTQKMGEIFADDTIHADAEALVLKMRDFVNHTLTDDGVEETLNRMREMAGVEVSQPRKAIEVLANNVGLTQGESDSVLGHFLRGGDNTLWGVQNALTAMSQDDDVSFERAKELEIVGGELLQPRKYDRQLLAA